MLCPYQRNIRKWAFPSKVICLRELHGPAHILKNDNTTCYILNVNESETRAFKWYVANLENHINYARWIEYAVSSSVMIVVISMLVGIYDIVAFIAIFSVNACMNLFGMLMEMYNQKRDKVNWTPFIFGTLAGLVPWMGSRYT